MSQAVAVHGARFAYNAHSVIEDLSLEVDAGDFFIVIGPNGSGKTTLLRLVLGSLKPAAGTVDLFGRPAARFGRRDLARRATCRSAAKPWAVRPARNCRHDWRPPPQPPRRKPAGRPVAPRPPRMSNR